MTKTAVKTRKKLNKNREKTGWRKNEEINTVSLDIKPKPGLRKKQKPQRISAMANSGFTAVFVGLLRQRKTVKIRNTESEKNPTKYTDAFVLKKQQNQECFYQRCESTATLRTDGALSKTKVVLPLYCCAKNKIP